MLPKHIGLVLVLIILYRYGFLLELGHKAELKILDCVKICGMILEFNVLIIT